MLQQVSVTANPYIHRVRRSLQQTQSGAADLLVLAHNDAQLLTQLDAAFPDSLLAVIALPQSQWQADVVRLTEAMAWAVEEAGVKGVLLIGHSQANWQEEQVRLLGGKARSLTSKQGQTALVTDSLFDRVRNAQLRTAQIEEEFIRQINKLSQATAIKHQLQNNQLHLHGLFYRGESGVFCLYDQQQRKFSLLKENIAA